ncbi:MAG: glycosyltransferase [Methylomonas sp.]|jgi:glycosyltransferase involved in cell wall biosynthesis|uniref:glycosyltransferase n=1 Tax=Methylomonas sp. TaxID=418 RepID=UPI0025F9F6CD|nr:glycosyltransferase [Methylomonas sp.]MCK9606061.1 glycosyltransferase [Methylomonas sp.]
MKNILMIAYHFPPVRVSSGIQRTLKFANYLLDHDWKALVLTVDPRAYDNISSDQVHEIPSEVVVKRAFALDTARHLSLKGRYLGWMALPDRWVSWCFGGVYSGLALIKRYRPKVLWSTYPIATAHVLGLILHRISGIPWIADFRDSMTEDGYPTNPLQRKFYLWIERQTVKHCSRAVFTTPGAIRMYAERYPEIPLSRWALIPNGYDEENFARAERSEAYLNALDHKTGQKILLHSGILYPSERDPTQFFMALAELQQAGILEPSGFKVILRATGHDDLYRQFIRKFGLENLVFLEPNVGYETALAEMLSVDGLLVFQASNCNHQIPAKIYEYLRAKRPILALTDPQGDTASVLRAAGITTIVPLDDQVAIAGLLRDFVTDTQGLKDVIASEATIAEHSRQSRTRLLVKLLDDVA